MGDRIERDRRALQFIASQESEDFELWGGRLSLPLGTRYAIEEAIQHPFKVTRSTLSGPATFYRSANMVRKFEQNYIIVTYLESGKIIHRIGHDYAIAGPAILLYRPGGGYHAFMSPEESSDLMIYQALIAPHLLAPLIRTSDLKFDSIPLMMGEGRASFDVLKSLFHEGPYLEQKSLEMLSRSFLKLLSSTLERFTEDHSANTTVSRHYRNITLYIENNINDETLSAERIAGSMGISARYFSLILAKHGTRFSTLVREMRLELAHSLITAGKGYKATEVAAMCGFRCMPHFHRAFRARFGTSPMRLSE